MPFINEYLKYEVKGKDYFVDNEKIRGTKHTIGKFKNGKTNFDKRINTNIMNELKANVIGNIENIIKTSKIYQQNLKDTKKHEFADTFDRRKSTFNYNNQYYTVLIEIGKKDGIQTLYSIEKIKKISSPTQVNNSRNTNNRVRLY